MDLTTLISGAVGAFVAAWAGAYIGFRRGKKERALDRRISWHEEAIKSVALYEERLERLHNHALNVLIIQPRSEPSSVSGHLDNLPPARIRAPAPLWHELAEAEARTRAALRLADLYTEGRSQLDCSAALSQTVNMVAKQWTDIGPEPAIPWADLRHCAIASGTLRRGLQDSLKVVLELDGILASLLGPRYRRWLALRRIEQLRTRITKNVS
jgi:hypothetical protein